MTALTGEIKNNTIVVDQDLSAYNGNTVVITILDNSIQKRRRNVNLNSYSRRTERGQNADAYVRGLRENDRV